MYESKREPGKKFMNKFVGKRFDSYAAEPQPGEANDNEHSEPQHHGADSVNTNEPSDKMKNKHAEDVHAETPEATVASHGPAHTIHYEHDHENGVHKVKSEHADGHTTESSHSSTADAYGHGEALAYEAGGEEQATSPKKRNHDPEQGAEGESKNYETPDLV
jgi:hypothetical protein